MAAVPVTPRRPPAPSPASVAVGALVVALTVLAGPAALAELVVGGGGDGGTRTEAGAGPAGGPDAAALTSVPAPAGLPTVAPPPTAPPGPPAAPPPLPPLTPAAGSPDRVVIPAIDVDAPVLDLTLDADGELEVPGWDDAGWWRDGPRPGDPGPAVIVGHVDSRTGPAVFHDLEDLDPGDVVDVTLDGGGTARFAVERTERFAKDEFPTLAVYGLTPGPELRLVTCGGAFDDDTGHYLDNLVVFATAI